MSIVIEHIKGYLQKRGYPKTLSDTLKVWDELGLDFKQLQYSETDYSSNTLRLDEKRHTAEDVDYFREMEDATLGTIVPLLSIEPMNASEHVLLVKWLLNKWKTYYYSQYNPTEYKGVVPVERKKVQFSKLIHASSDIKAHALEQLPIVKRQIIKEVGHESGLAKLVYEKLKTGAEEEFYRYPVDLLSIISHLRVAARIWDLTLYRIFLENILIEGSAALFKKPDYVHGFLIQIDERQIQPLYEALSNEGFIKKDELVYQSFLQALTYKPVDKKIIWIDKSRETSNLKSLYRFVDTILDIPQGGKYTEYDFIRNNFLAVDEERPGIGKPFNDGSLHSTRQHCTKKDATDRELKIMKLLKDIIIR